MPEGRDQHAPHAVREPADDRAGLAVPRGPAAGGGRLAAVEPHLRRQPQLQHGAAQRRHALHRRRQAGAGPDRDHRAQPRARSRRPCTSTCRAASTCCCRSWRRTRRCARNFFRDLDMLFYAARRAAAEPLGPPARRWPATRSAATWPCSRPGARPRPRRSPPRCTSRWSAPASSACRSPGCELKLVPAGGKLEVRVRGPQRHAGLLQARRPDRARRSTRKASTASATRCKLADPADPAQGHRLRRPRGRGLQAHHRHLGARRRAAREADRRRRPAHPGRRHHRPRPRRDRRAGVPEPGRQRTCDLEATKLAADPEDASRQSRQLDPHQPA